MGRAVPSVGAPPASQRKDARAKRAKQTVNKDIPALLQAYPRARKGIEATELIADPSAAPTYQSESSLSNVSHTGKPAKDELHVKSRPVEIRFQYIDTLEAAASLHQMIKRRNQKSSRLAILNMASPLRPGGGFLNGATAQEETLCTRTTLYQALKEEFYRLPEVGGIYTSDVLVFRSSNIDMTDLPKNERFFVDVITAGMHRMPDVDESEDGEKHYANPKDREMAENKIRGVMRIAKTKGIKKLVVGAWGCGAYQNPVQEIANAWKRVLLPETNSSPASAVKHSKSIVETWDGMEIVFAIKEKRIAEQFASIFGQDLVDHDTSKAEEQEGDSDDADEPPQTEAENKVIELENRIATTKNEILKKRLESILSNLKSNER